VRCFLIVALVALAAPVRAEVSTDLASGGRVDWSRGVVTVIGVGLADRHAPAPAVGRAASRRRADEDARAKLATALGEVPWITGEKPGDLATREGWIEAHAVTLAADLAPDGSWRVTVGLPVEAIRLGLAGPRALPADGDAAKGAIVVDATKLDATPTGGATIGGAGAQVLWVDAPPPAALVGAKPEKRAAKAVTAGAVEVDGKALAADDVAGRLIVVVVRRP
jgi:hypothetical protein